MKSDLPLDFFLERTQRLMKRINNPEKQFKAIHVAGTSGKGSTSAMIYSLLLQDQKNVGLYLSPYVSVPTENIHVNGSLVAPDAFADAIEQVRPVIEDIEQEDPEWMPSYAEIFFAVALIHFSSMGVEWLVIETGCGGRYDKTNVFDAPLVCVLTNVSLDHTALLGETECEIADHKAGIIKPGALLFSSETRADVRDVFNAEATKVGAEISYIAPTEHYDTAMPGEHQQWNANLAASVGAALGVPLPTIRAGIAEARLPARVELMQDRPRVIIDGAHSPAKIASLVEALETLRPWKKLHLVFAVKETKQPLDLLTPLLPFADSVTVTNFILPGFRSHEARGIVDDVMQKHPTTSISVETDSARALEHVLATAAKDDIVLITGSLYLAGELRQHWISNEQILTSRSSFI